MQTLLFRYALRYNEKIILTSHCCGYNTDVLHTIMCCTQSGTNYKSSRKAFAENQLVSF